MSAIKAPKLPQKVLTIGIDASGKSTFLEGLSERYGYEILEPTSSSQARKFKAETIDTPLTGKIITAREGLYLELNATHSRTVDEKIVNGAMIATTGSRLVTLISHAVMRRAIAITDGVESPIEIAKNEVRDGEIPEALCFTHAPFSVIRQRIQSRQKAGDELERFWGFNSLFFLEKYQDTWLDVVNFLDTETDMLCINFDTSVVSPAEMLDSFELACTGIANGF